MNVVEKNNKPHTTQRYDELAAVGDREATGADMPAKDEPLSPLNQAKTSASAARAAWYPHIPCTPPPGGVEDEQR